MLFSFQISSLFLILLYAVVILFNVTYIQSIGSSIDVFSVRLLFLDFSVDPILLSFVLPGKPLLTKAEKEKLVLPENLQNILVGLLLGDVSGEKQALNPRMRFKQSTIHKEYLLHLYNLFKTYCPGTPNTYYYPISQQNGKVHSSIWFHTYSLPCFTELYNLFYLEGKKVIPNNIFDLLSPLGLAYWLCDDGGFNKLNRAVILSTQCFSLEQVNLLSNVLAEKFNLKCSVNKNENAYVIRISAKSLPILQSLLKDIMPPMMLYKLGL